VRLSRAGLYTRVSTSDQQTIPLQIRGLREYAARRGWQIALQIKEVGSGASQRQLREKVLDAARRREVDVVLVWRLDRWGRSVADLLSTLQELQHLGVGFVSLTEALDLTTPAGPRIAAAAVCNSPTRGYTARSRTSHIPCGLESCGFCRQGCWSLCLRPVDADTNWCGPFLSCWQSAIFVSR
jgi:hypothetical protein